MKNKPFLYLIFILIFLLYISCKNDSKNVDSITSFDVSADGNFIVYSFAYTNKISIYKANIDGSDIQLLASDQDYSFFSPKITPDGKTVFFIGTNKKNAISSIWQVHKDRAPQKIFEDVGFISDVIFSRNCDSLFYIKANEYSSYSPIAPKANHNFDIYSIDIDNPKSKKISTLNAYSLSDLNGVDENKIIISQRGSDAENGIFFYNKNSNELEKIETTNDTLRHSTGYSNPVLLNDNTIICASYYQLVKIDLVTKLEKTILPSNGYHFRKICYNRKLKRIFFTKRDDTQNIYSIDTNGGNLREIAITNSN